MFIANFKEYLHKHVLFPKKHKRLRKRHKRDSMREWVTCTTHTASMTFLLLNRAVSALTALNYVMCEMIFL